MEVTDGLSHHGEPAEEEEVIVIEEPEKAEKAEPKVIRAPRVPTQEERDAHEATHIPHEEWCEVCVAGRGRNKAHKRRKDGPGSSSDGNSWCVSGRGRPSKRAGSLGCAWITSMYPAARWDMQCPPKSSRRD